jgi:lipid II:glycine glycyltransferase (peptidoglycan interpeptide bridge formation enzyme)
MEMFFTKEQKWLEKWDDFLISNDIGNHFSLSDWLNSYSSYGFDFEVCIFLKEGKIIGGYGSVIAKVTFFKFYCIPSGPIFSSGYEDYLQIVSKELLSRAAKLRCCYVQFSIPTSDNLLISTKTFSKETITPFFKNYKNGNKFKHIYNAYGINWVDFNDTKSSEELLKQFSVHVRRNIKLSYASQPQITYAITSEECKFAYTLIEENAKIGNYKVRSFEDFGDTILKLITANRAYFIIARVNNDIKGVAFCVKGGNVLTYITGGTKKEKPDLKIGYLLHWEIIKKSYELGYSGDNISMGGTKGVVEFKAKFNTKSILFDEPFYYFIINPFLFNLYLCFKTFLSKHKKSISLLLRQFKKKSK